MPKTPDLNVNRSIGDIIAQGRKPRLQPETGWYKVGVSEAYAVSFINSWGNAGVVAGITNAPTGWYLSEDGEVRLRGKITGGVAATTVFNLPEEVRPEYAETFICAVDGGGKANVTIKPNGDVIVDTIN